MELSRKGLDHTLNEDRFPIPSAIADNKEIAKAMGIMVSSVDNNQLKYIQDCKTAVQM